MDFYSPSCKLAIEIDGDSHYQSAENQTKDEQRDIDLAGHGIRVLRFTNYEVMTNLEGVYSKIMEEVESLTPSSSPPIASTRQGEKIYI